MKLQIYTSYPLGETTNDEVIVWQNGIWKDRKKGVIKR